MSEPDYSREHPYYLTHGKEDLSGKLWQFIAKEHMENMVDAKISKSKWLEFVDAVCESFCDKVSRDARYYWEEWSEEESK